MTQEFPNLSTMQTFTEDTLPSLSVATLGALELFVKEGLPQVKIKDFKRPVIVGSGNAIVTARLLYGNSEAYFADENNYKDAFRRTDVDGVLLFSASGGKHAPIIAQEACKRKLAIQLITCMPQSPTEKIIGTQNVIVTPKNREPYTYNTSTYLGWVLAKTKEDPKKILRFINSKIAKAIPRDLNSFNGFLLVTPNSFSLGNHLFEVKFIELFGRQIARDVKTFEELKHAITVVPSTTELCIQFGKGKVEFENEILKIPLPESAGPAMIMAIGYYIIGKIQEQHRQYFKDHIHTYIQCISRDSFGKGMNVIVE